jgi:hypothetical protein
MPEKHTIKFYPVDNADTTLIKLIDNTTIVVDCQFRDGKENSDGVQIFPVKDDLLNSLEKDRSENFFVDLFINTHPHEDHCLGYNKNFFVGDPKDYKKANKDNNEVIIGELWVTQMVFSKDLCDDGLAIQKEVRRRKKLFENKTAGWDSYGNRLRIIGYNESDTTVEGLHYIPGTTVDTINGNRKETFFIFIHAPFKSSLVSAQADKELNQTSIVIQANFKTKPDGDVITRLMIGGDADHYTWEQILNKSKRYGNTARLEWDLFLSPHHCSWSYFNDTPYDNNPEPKKYSLEILDYGRTNSHIIASSKKIEDKEPNPPHYPAKEQYVEKVGEDHFKNTAIHKGEKAPKPLVYTTDESGFELDKSIISAAASIMSKPTPRAGKV